MRRNICPRFNALPKSTPKTLEPVGYTQAGMSSKRRKAASRANGKKSHGPVTPEGKARSAANTPPARHGLASPSPDRAARAVCLNNESRAEFLMLYDSLVSEHFPATTTEHITVHEMAVARWRMNRAWAMETALLDNQMDTMRGKMDEEYEKTDGATRAALAFSALAKDSPGLPLLLRYEARLTRQFDRCLTRLAALRNQRDEATLPAEPNPINEHLPNDSQLRHSEPTGAPQPAPRETTGPAVATLVPTPPLAVVHPEPRPCDPEPLPGIPPPIPRAA